MNEFWSALLDGVSAVQLVVWVGASVTVVVLLVKVWPALTKFVMIMNAVSGLPKFITDMEKQVGEIHHETHYNNGSSIKDATKRTEREVKQVHEKLDTALTDLTTLRASDDEITRLAQERLRRLERVEHNTLTPEEKNELRALLAERRQSRG